MIGDRGAIAFADCIRHNTSLTSLDLCVNNIGASGAAALLDALEAGGGTSMIELRLDGNKIPVEVTSRIQEQLLLNVLPRTIEGQVGPQAPPADEPIAPYSLNPATAHSMPRPVVQLTEPWLGRLHT